MAKVKRCRGTKKDGSPCTSNLVDAEGYCFAHNPNKDAERTETRRKGGRNSAAVVRLVKLAPARLMTVYDRLETAFAEVHEGKLEPKIGGALAAIANAMTRVLTSGELEQRVRALESGREDGRVA